MRNKKKSLVREPVKKTTEKIYQGDLLWENFYSNSPYIIVILDKYRNITWINRVVKGFKKEQVIGMCSDHFITPEYIPKQKSIIKQVFKTKKYGRMEIYAAGAEGKNAWYESLYIPVISNKKVISIILVTRDISERKRAEQASFENKIGLDMILSQSPAFVWTTDKKMNITSLNGSGLKKFKIKPEKNIGISINDFFGTKNKNHPSVQMHKLALKGEQITRDVEIDDRYFHTHIEPFYTREGQFTGSIGFAIDISERKEYELQLEKSRETYRNLVEYSPDGVFIHDKKGNILFANSVALEIMGLKNINEMENRSLFHFLLPEYHDQVRERGTMMQQGKQVPFLATRVRRSDGKIIEVESKPIPFIYEGQKAILVVYHDISYQRELEREQMRAQLAEETNATLQAEIEERLKAEQTIKQSLKEKEVLLQEVHHRVKNNLQVISSILNLQSSYIKDPNMINLLKESQNRIKSMAYIHESLYQSNDISLINFSEYVNNLTRNLVHSYSSKEIKVEPELETGNIFLTLDAAIPSGLIINELVSNSMKYAFKGRKEGRIKISISRRNEDITLKISDNGVGMPANMDFRKTESLGLQLVITLVEQLHGKIRMENKNGVNYILIFKNKH